jgi:lipopolysaccharide heptosyltransferase II
MKHKILIINLTRMGDILQSTPLLQTLKKQYPGAEIHYLVVQSFGEICRLIPEIDRIIPFEFNSAIAVSKNAIRHLPRRLSEVEAFIEKLRADEYDLVINLSHSRISALLSHLLAVPDTRGLTLDREGFRQITHPWAQYFFTANLNRTCNPFNLVDIHRGLAFDSAEMDMFLKEALNSTTPATLSVEIPPEAHLAAANLLQDWAGRDSTILFGFQPGASLPAKCWPANSFIELGRALRRECDAGILIFGNGKESDLAAGIAAQIGDRTLNLAGKTDLAALAALLNRVHLLVSNDTGTQHLASAVGTPVLSLCFGSALSHETGPYGSGHVVVEPSLPCFPCSFHVECKHFRCQEQVTPSAVAHLALNLVRGTELVTTADSDLLQDLKLWRTGFDGDGFWIERPVLKHPLTAEVLINLALRKIWKDMLLPSLYQRRKLNSGLAGMARDLWDYLPPQSATFGDDIRSGLKAFARLEELAISGQALCVELERLTLPPSEGHENMQPLADSLAAIDRDIAVIGAALPAVNHFVLDFSLGKQNLEGSEVSQLARATAKLYSRLAEGARRFQALLDDWERVLGATWQDSGELKDLTLTVKSLGNNKAWTSSNP